MLQAGLQRLLGARVDVACRLVQDQDTRVGEQHAREGDELALAGRQGRSALLHHRVVPVGQFHDELVRVHGLRRRLDFLVGGVELAVADVLAHVAGEDEGVLQHHAHLPAQRCERHVAHAVAVDRHRALGHVVEARQQVDDCRLAGARRADQRDRAPRFDVEVHEVEDVAAVLLVAEHHVVEVDAPADLRQVRRVGLVADLRRDVERLEDALEVRRAGDELVVEVADVDHRIPEVVRVADERDEHAGGHVHAPEAHHADEVDERDGHHGDGLHARPHEELDVHGVHPRGTHLALLFLEGPELGLLLCEGLRGLHAGDRLVDVGVQVALLVGELLEGAPLEDLQHAHPDDEHREQDQAPQGQLPVDHEHHDQRDHEGEHVGDHVDQTGAQRVRKRVHIVDHADQDLAVRARIEVAEGQRLDMREDIAAHVLEHELADARDRHRAVAQPELVQHDQRGEDHGEDAELAEVLVRDRLVDHDLGQVRHGDDDAAHRDDDDENARHLCHIRFEIFADAQDVPEVDLLLEFLILAVCIALCHKSSSKNLVRRRTGVRAACGRCPSSGRVRPRVRRGCRVRRYVRARAPESGRNP